MDRPVTFKQGAMFDAASPAPTCASDASDQSMDRPVTFKQSVMLDAASPAPTCTSDASDHSMDRPVTFKQRAILDAASPAPTCASDGSDQSMDRPVTFKQRAMLLAASPAPTYASDASDRSMDRPVTFKQSVMLDAASPAPTCTSDASDHSMDRPVTFKQRMKPEPASPAPTCASDASDHSMDRPVTFKRIKLEPASPAPTCASDSSDHSMDRPVTFKRPSPAPTSISMRGHLTKQPLLFNRGEDTIGELSACLLTEDHFRCPVCSDVLKEPVSIPCGHSYCKTCIQTYWNKPTHEGSYSCPQCRKRFRTRPALNPNSALATVVQKLQLAGFSPALPAHCYAGPGDVSCDFCTGRKLRAVKSCLTCAASYCETHVKQHYTVAALQRHRLVEATGDLEQRLCKLHQRALEVFCKTDQIFICFICTMVDHKGHETVLSNSEDSAVEIPVCQQVIDPVQVPIYKTEQSEDGKSSSESKMEQQLMQLLKELTARTEKAESELTERYCRGHEQVKDFEVEVAALGRPLDLGMLYDCHNDSFSSGVFLWDEDTLSTMRLSLPRPHTDVRILEGKYLQDRLRALDLTTAVRASVVSGLVEVSGAAGYLKHPTQSQLQDRVTVHYRATTRLDMLSHRLLHSEAPLSLTNQNSATHVVVAVLYGAQAYFVLDEKNEHSEESGKLKDEIKRNVESQTVDELLLNLEQADCFCECDLYADGEDFKDPVDFKSAVKQFRSLHELLEPDSERAVPLKVWLYPLKNLKPTSAYVVSNISEDLLNNAVDVLEHLEKNINISQDMMSINSTLGVPTWYPGLKEALFEYSALLQKYQSVFQKKLASCIRTGRERGEGEKNLRDFLKRNEQSPFSPQNTHHWLLNKAAKVVALNDCRSANITILKSQKALQQVIEDSQADKVLCFTLSSLEAKDPFLSALKQHMDLVNTDNTLKTEPLFKLPDIRHKIRNDFHLFLSSMVTNEDEEHIKFLVAFIPLPSFSEYSVWLYQCGNIVSSSVKLDFKPENPEILNIKQTFVSLRLHRSESSAVQWYTVEYRAVICRGNNRVCLKWRDVDICSTEETSVIRGLKPGTQYHLRYAVMDRNNISDYSRITEFQTLPRARPGQPTVLNQNSDSLTVSWQSPEADGDSPVLHYMVEYMEAGLEGWQSVLTEGPECIYTITHPYSTCYRVRVSAVYGEGDTSEPSEEKEVTLKSWSIDVKKRKASLFLEVLKLQTVKKPVELRGWSNKESEVRSFLQCLPFISQLRVAYWCGIQLFLHLLIKAAECERQTGEKTLELLISVCSYSSFPYGYTDDYKQSDFLLDLFSHVKEYETETGRSFLPALQPVYQSAPAVWRINLSEKKSSLLLEVLKLQTVKKPVELRGCSDEESEVRSFLQCLPFISQLSFRSVQGECKEWRKRWKLFLLDLCLQAALHQEMMSHTTVEKLISWAYSNKEDFFLDLFSHVKKYETETGRTILPALQPVYQSAPAVWSINLSERKSSLFLEVLKLQPEKRPVEIRGWSCEGSKVRSFLHCLPFMSQLRIDNCSPITKNSEIFMDLLIKAAECERQTGEKTLELLSSVCSYSSFPYGDTDDSNQTNYLLDLFSHVKKYETETGRTILPALQPVYRSAPAVWRINLSERKISLLLEVLKLQTEKKPVELRGWSDEESEVRSFLQCLPFISQLSFRSAEGESDEWRKRVNSFLLDLCLQAALHQKEDLHSTVEKLISCSYGEKSDFLLDLFSHVKKYETETGRTVLPALQPVYQSAPAVWSINLSERKSSLFLEVLKLQTVKKPVELRGCSDEESEVRSFLQCLPFISQLRIGFGSDIRTFLDLLIKAAECERQTGEKTLELVISVCSYSSFPYGYTDEFTQSEYLLDLFSHVKKYETETGRTILPALQPFYQSAPAVWRTDLSDRKSSLLLEVLKLQTVQKPVELWGCSDEESEVRSFLQCLPFISQLSFICGSGRDLQFLVKLITAAAECDSTTGQNFTKLLTSVCSYTTFPYREIDEQDDEFYSDQSKFLLDLFSHVKKYETETVRTILPALQPVYQSAPAVWSINLSERKSSLFLEVLKLQTVKKPVELRGCSDEESEVRSFLQCLPFISQLSFNGTDLDQFLVKLITAAAECDSTTGENFTKLLTSVCSYTTFPYREIYEQDDELSYDQSNFLLDLFSHVKEYETETGRTILPALQPVYQSVPAVWRINLSERKSSLFLEVLKLQPVKKPVELRGWSDEESEVRSFLQCLPFISQLRFRSAGGESDEWRKRVNSFLLDLCLQAALHQKEDLHSTVERLISCSYSEKSDFLLDLFSHVKKYETETGRTILPALQPVYQSAPAVWRINLSERKSSLFLEVLKLQTVKKPVELRGCSDEESEVRSFLQCLPFISQLSFNCWRETDLQFLVKLITAAAECDSTTGENFTKLLTSVCSYTTFPYREIDEQDDEFYSDQSDFLLDLFSHVKKYETETGRTILPALQPVYQSVPAVWRINLSERKSSLFLEVLKLQTVKKPVELIDCSDEESEVRSFLQCLPFISQLRGAEKFVPVLCKHVQSVKEAKQATLLLQALDFSLTLEGKLPTSSCRAVGRVLRLSDSKLNLTLNPQSISLRGTRLLFRPVKHLQTLRLNAGMVLKVERALRAVRFSAPVTIKELSLIHSKTKWTDKKLSKILSGLASLLRLCDVQCLNLTEHRMEPQSLTVLLCHQDPLTIRLSKETLQQMVVMVYETQEEEFTHSFLQKVGGDLESCSLNWEMIPYFLQYHSLTVDFRKSKINQQNFRELVTVLDRVQIRRLSSRFLLSIIREIYETGSAHCVSSLLNSTQNCINLNSRELDSVHCAALCFILQHSSTAVSLSLLWTSIPEGELESIVPLLNHVSNLSVDRLLLLRLLHCCSVSELQQGAAAAALLSALQHRLDFSCSSTLDLTEHTQTHTLSSEDCRVISTVIQRAFTHTQLILQDCEIEEAGVEQLFSVLHTVRLHCSKALLLQFLTLVRVESEMECVRRAASLSQALSEELDLSQTQLDLQACRTLALFLEYSEGLSELDLSHCQITDHCLELLLPHLHKTCILDLSHNDITDVSANRIYNIVSVNSSIQTVRLFNNRITDRQLFLSDQRFEIW
ncbi:uncharacterized protein LOC111190427 isoform X3 [Astyanax mexicanus]|uniref:uncharacterized protein LOC111190427 isoform X3 n=1 Tax=Astyanax mexicanus TaxID=7994 RepID=UPI0020CB40E8|nr:uncharacterized protein LOC111190427 isoform X3 [Astyanax mexicanus]